MLPFPEPPPAFEPARAPEPPRPAGRLQPIAPQQHVLRVTVGDEFAADLKAIKQELSHKLPGGGLEEVLHECIRIAPTPAGAGARARAR
jgi:pyruvate-formate lyase-activating enzyme